MILLEGIAFSNGDPKLVYEYLSSISRKSIWLKPSNLKVSNDGKFLILQTFNGVVEEYPIRKSFLYKLLRWYSFPLNQLHRMSIDTVTSLCNDFLLNIRADLVNVKLENDEALTILSPEYNELTDLEIIKLCSSLGIESVSRNDFFLRIYTLEKLKAEPVPGDLCGFSLNIFNSETGFGALRVAHYILRYTCRNGAIVKVDGANEKIFHYGYSEGELQKSLNTQIIKAHESRLKLIQYIKKSNEENLFPYLTKISKKIDRLLGKNSSQKFLRELQKNSTLYDLFNVITSKAKDYDISKRFYLERIAGELISD